MRRPAWKLVYFHHGRHERYVQDPVATNEIVKRLNAKGVKAALIRSRKPLDRIKTFDDYEDGKLYCPYCMKWRWFKIPNPIADPQTFDERIMNSISRLEIRVCPYCWVTENDFYVRSLNHEPGTFGKKRRRRRRRRSFVRG